ncbi:hypothetical protein BHE74_00026705 [Ensete ventricosum]|nr:hypothetical protein GW17_00040780 [Ensete ventricosum]RWW65956.1 hypothetical protein BHE74_00026705 [Ensete ventricosum]RZR99556.1 hypothetical protein BHM03_00029123 [Ensete ventricosum]
MFLEGFQKPLGCTILLKGAHSDELKKIKRVVQYAVFAAYHLILETSFLVDLRVFSSNKNDSREEIAHLRTMPLPCMDNLERCLSTLASEHTQDAPVCNGSLGRFDHRLMSLNSDFECIFSDKSSSGDISLLSPLSGIEEHAVSLLEEDPCIPHDPILPPEDDQNHQEICVSPPGDVLIDHSIHITEVPHIGKATDLELKNAETIAESETPPPTSLSNEYPSISDDVYAKSEGPEELIWTSFSDLREICKKDLYGGSLRKLEFVNTYAPSHLSSIHQTSISEVELLHFAVGPGENVLSASENEISSIIACALAISEDFQGLLDRAENEAEETDRSFSFTCDGYEASACMSSTGASESERINLLHSASSLSLDESSTSSIDEMLSL